MKTHEEIGKEVWRDWTFHNYNVREPDETNMGDVADWAVSEYIRELLGIYSCHRCHVWFDNVNDLCDHLESTHGTKIVDSPRSSGYSDYGNTYFRDSRINHSLATTVRDKDG